MKKILAISLLIILSTSACTRSTLTPTRALLQPTETGSSLVIESPTPETRVSPPAEVTPVPTVQFTSSPPAVCRVAPVIPEVDAMTENKIPAITETDHDYGSTTPKVTILTYCSYQRPACKSLALNLAELQLKYKDELRIVSRIFPQPAVDDKSELAARAAEAAGVQNRFWEMNNLLYSKQSDWVFMSLEEFSTWVADQAVSLGIPETQFEADLNSPSVDEKVLRMKEEGTLLQLSDTPVLYYNGVLVKSGVDVESLEVMIKYFLLPEKAFDSCPEMTIDPARKYTAIFSTEKGDVVFELYPDKAPWAVNSFVFLARRGWYDNSGFYRVVPGFVVQGGDPTNSGLGSPGFNYSNEVDPSLRFNEAGILAMANQGPDNNGSQFFITYTGLPELDGQYTIFGRVIDGMNVLSSLRPRNPGSDQILLPPDVLISVTIKEE